MTEMKWEEVLRSGAERGFAKLDWLMMRCFIASDCTKLS
jgi:hypothetical protein